MSFVLKGLITEMISRALYYLPKSFSLLLILLVVRKSVEILAFDPLGLSGTGSPGFKVFTTHPV